MLTRRLARRRDHCYKNINSSLNDFEPRFLSGRLKGSEIAGIVACTVLDILLILFGMSFRYRREWKLTLPPSIHINDEDIKRRSHLWNQSNRMRAAVEPHSEAGGGKPSPFE